MKKLSVFSAFALTVAMLFPIVVTAAEDTSAPIEKLISEMAANPAQHQALANYYKEKIVQAKSELAAHEKMRKAYIGGFEKSQHSNAGMRKHCDTLIKNTESSIKAYEALVTEHEALASKKP
ncbi:hypothetical protein [Cellvibrio sp. pealriver]|jgi:hypothetical protein|uniref:hypothetical protein n=1 Tax=Cellvibrio sp. pealriver TaxID=1622269 RepID=UPI00066FD08D|nr:hypothetical protein [Cellvibrio sp. pealriver]